MTTITTINQTDQVLSSLQDINDNFDALNNDKVEADSTDTFTNKTIDAEDNTLSNIDTDMMKSSAKTGDATKTVTGSAGVPGNLAFWDGTGNIVDSNLSVGDPSTELSDDADVIPVMKQVKEYTDGVLKQMWVPVSQFFDASDSPEENPPYQNSLDNFAVTTMDASDIVRFSFKAPTGLNSFTSAKVSYISTDTGTFRFVGSSTYASSNALYNGSNATTGNIDVVSTQDFIHEVDVTDILQAVIANELVGVSLEFDSLVSGAGAPMVLGLKLEWE